MSSKNILKRLYGLLLLLAALVIVIECANPLGKMIFAWELDSLSIRQKWLSPIDRSHIVPIRIIGVDSKTMGNRAYQQAFNYLFSREAAAYAIRFLNRSKKTKVILDASFNSGKNNQDPVGDQMLVNSLKPGKDTASMLIFSVEGSSQRALASQEAVVQAWLKQIGLQVQGIEQFPVYERNYTYNTLIPPYTALLKSPMQFYSANGTVFRTDLAAQGDDFKGDSRRWTPFSLYGGFIYPTGALGAILNGEKQLKLSKDGQLNWQGGHLNLGADGVPLIKWQAHGVYPNRPVYPEYSFGDVVISEMVLECREKPSQGMCSKIALPKQPLLNPAIFDHQYVLIGFTVGNSGDEHQTIYSSRYPGVYIVANSLDNVLNNDFVKPAPLWMNWGFLLLLPVLLLAALLRFNSALLGLLIAATLSVSYFMLTLHAYLAWNLWLWVIYPLMGLWACYVTVYILKYFTEYKKRQQMRFAFGKYVSPAVLQIIEQNPDKITLGGERREMTFMFSDIRGFTAYSDQNPPEMVQAFLSQYFSTMNHIIMHTYRGSINKLIGDAIMAYWGFPLDNEDHAFLAVSAAMAMREAMLAWRNQEGKLPINIGIGINTGEAVIGNVGSEDFMDFTVIGDAVNVASRLEGANKEYGSTILISASTYEKVKDRIHVRALGWAELKGKGAQVEVFEPIGYL